MNYRSLSLRGKHIHINKTVHKIFWEAGNRRLKSTRSTFDRLRITINSLKLPYEANSKHYEILKILQIALFRNVFQKKTKKGISVLIPGFGLSLSEMRTRPCHDWNEAQQQFYPWTFVGRDAHRIKYTVHTSFSYFAKKYQHNVTKCISTDG